MKQTGLRADPDKVRAWQDRSRAPLAQDPDKALKRNAPLRAVSERDTEGREGQRFSTLRRTGFPRAHDRPEAADVAREASGPKREVRRVDVSGDPVRTTLKAALATVQFRARVPANERKCGRCPRTNRRRATSYHHWLEQTDLKKLMLSLARRAGWTQQQAMTRLGAWLNDGRNLTPMCTDCHAHGGNINSTKRFRAHEVPASAVEFATEVDDELEAAGLRREAVVILTREYQ